MASAMLVEQRLQGCIDQVEQLIHFTCAAATHPSHAAATHRAAHPHPPHPHLHPPFTLTFPFPFPSPATATATATATAGPAAPLLSLWQVGLALRRAARLRHADRAHLPLRREHRGRDHQEAAAAARDEQLIETPLPPRYSVCQSEQT